MTENKEVMASNIRRYMALNNITATDICKALKFKQNTFSDWINAKTYPRIDKIELMANYFNITKSELVEKYNGNIDTLLEEIQKDTLFMENIKILFSLSPEIKKEVYDFIRFKNNNVVQGDTTNSGKQEQNKAGVQGIA